MKELWIQCFTTHPSNYKMQDCQVGNDSQGQNYLHCKRLGRERVCDVSRLEECCRGWRSWSLQVGHGALEASNRDKRFVQCD